MPENREHAGKETVLRYCLPKPLKVHTVLHVPGSHTLYVGPNSCTRRHYMHAAQYGDRRDVSFYFITEADVISGRYEDLIVEAIGDLLEILEPQPMIFMIAVFCIDDFLGTDEAALLDRLRECYPGRQFAFQHIDPVSLSEKKIPGMKTNSTMYSFIRPAAAHDTGINFLGHFVSLDQDCEFLQLLHDWGCGPVRELFTCRTYDEYQAMGRSVLNIVFRDMGKGSAEYMQKRHGIPYYMFTEACDAEDVVRRYHEIAEILGKPCPDFSEELAAVSADAAETVRLLGGIPVAVDSSASLKPAALAKALLGYGFNVRYIFKSSQKYRLEPEAEKYLAVHHPDILITEAGSSRTLYTSMHTHGCLAIGLDAARVLRAEHMVDMWHDEGYFGLQGIHRLFADMRKAMLETKDWSEAPALEIGRNAEDREVR